MNELCWFHRFGCGEQCPNLGTWWWPNPPDTPGRGVLLAMRWCDEHKHNSDRRLELLSASSPEAPEDQEAAK